MTEYILIGLCVVIIILLVVILMRQPKNQGDADISEIKNGIDHLSKMRESDNNLLLNQTANQSEKTVNQIVLLGKDLRESQTSQQAKADETLEDIQKEINTFRTENQESLTKINQVVTEKMQSTMDEKLNNVSQTVVKTMSELSKSMNDSQDKQRAVTTERLEKLEGSFQEIRKEMNVSLMDVKNSNTVSMEKQRKENQDSLDKINNTVNEKLQKTLDERLATVSQTLTKNMTELSKSLNDSQDKQRAATSERLEKLEGSFQVIRQEMNKTLLNIQNSNNESMEKLRKENQESLDKINGTVNEKLQKTLDDKISKSFETVNARLKEVYEGLGEMKSVASGVTDLKNVLSNVKTRGILGEIQLSMILEDILAPEQYEEQKAVVPGSKERVDFAVKLPGNNEDSVYLPIDSKFPGDTYANLMDAYDTGNVDLIKNKRDVLKKEIMRAAKSIHDKYIEPPYTTNFAIMFLPFEGLYAEVVNMGLVEELQRNYSVNIAGPSTMAAMLNSLQMGFRTLAIQKKSDEVWKILEAAKTEFGKFEDTLTKARSHLQMVDRDLDSLIGTRTRGINRKLRSLGTLDSQENSAALLELDNND